VPLSNQMPSPRRKGVLPATWYRVRVDVEAGAGSGIAPGDLPVAAHGGDLEHARRDVRPVRRRETVEAAVGLVLGQVAAPPDRIDGDGFVLEPAQGGAADGGRRDLTVDGPRERMALPDIPAIDLLA
jgi:hypothetical protein